MARSLSASYDPDDDAAYIWLADGDVDRTVDLESSELGKPLLLDLDRSGRIIGMEVLNASRHLHVASHPYEQMRRRPGA